jgi:hypothetical protein
MNEQGGAPHFRAAFAPVRQRTIRMKKLLWSLSALVIYVVAYAVLVDTHEPSIWDDYGDPAFRSSYPKVSQGTIKNMGITLVFLKVGPANYIFLPIDQCWRCIKGLPPSIITDSDSYWSEYFDYKFASGEMKRGTPKAEKPGAAQPATKPADKVPAEVQPPPPSSKDRPR